MTRTKKKNDITLLTLLSHDNDVVGKSREILKRYGNTDAQNKRDLEKKLADLYFNNPGVSQKQLDLEFATIHPHKDWLIRTLELVPKSQIQTTPQITKDDILTATQEAVSKFSGPDKKSSCCGCKDSSSFAGGVNNSAEGQRYVINLIGLVAVIGITYHFLKTT